ncbi:carboxylesterase family protein [Pseudonocardia spinosispora]|uniref:carboxylesterase family protein n=1 Tax=Pseudonocardia spinosispora TaxID=103441 RepID=UPI0004243419|nr:carboxylesterase family protein [Pseudonocardia spinosispora]
MSDPIVEIAQGRLRGVGAEGVTVYRGVPFAAPPVGELRFRAPRPPRPWADVRDAAHSGPASYQVNTVNGDTVRRIVAEIDPGAPGIMAWPPYTCTTYQQDNAAEDCLYLDIWVPDTEPGEHLPVYVYFHGGANAVSAGSFVHERGATLARTQRVIVVRPNYRMGALGWLHVGLVGNALPEAVNLGVQDQVAALRWVHESIAAFGGDPEQICIGGESAGATAVSHLLGIPAARRLVRRAVIQSLSPFNPWCTQQRPDAETVVELYVRLLGLHDPAELVQVDPDRLLAVANVLTRWFPADAAVAWRPLGAVTDGDWVPRTPARSLSETDPGLNGIEVTIGFAKDEWMFFRGHSDTVSSGSRANVLAVLDQIFDTGASAVYDRFAELHPDDTPGQLLSDIMSTATSHSRRCASRRTSQPAGSPSGCSSSPTTCPVSTASIVPCTRATSRSCSATRPSPTWPPSPRSPASTALNWPGSPRTR